jgi:hypothetical protein
MSKRWMYGDDMVREEGGEIELWLYEGMTCILCLGALHVRGGLKRMLVLSVVMGCQIARLSRQKAIYN